MATDGYGNTSTGPINIDGKHPSLGEINSVFPDWIMRLPYQMQTVLALSLRGPDGVRKHHPCKIVIRNYRGSVLKAARYGEHLRVGEAADTFMSLLEIADRVFWDDAIKSYMDSVDELPHHYHMHLIHASLILAIHCPNPTIKVGWRQFYVYAVNDLHLNVETDQDLCDRLSDWDRAMWR